MLKRQLAKRCFNDVDPLIHPNPSKEQAWSAQLGHVVQYLLATLVDACHTRRFADAFVAIA